MDIKLPNGTKVIVTLGNFAGKIVGHSYLYRDKDITEVYLVELNNGFYNPDKTLFISTIPCVRDCLKVLR